LPYNINDPLFARALVESFHEIVRAPRNYAGARHATYR
jgi:hypothetical protein